jgi:hypothetical protein
MKQLLALSEDENRRPASTASAAKPALPASSATSGEMLQKAASRERSSKRKHHKKSTQAPNPAKPKPGEAQIEDKIRQRAYELYQERGGVNGDPNDDWLQAKQEVLSRKARAGNGSAS